MGFLAMAGFNAEQTLGAMPGTLQLAASAQMELADTADIVSNVLTGFQKPVSELAAVNDTLVKTFTRTNTDLAQLGHAFKFVGPVAAAAGVDFNETAAAIGLLGNAGIQGEMAGTALRGAITKILAPSKEARGIMRELGIELTDTTGNILPLSDVLEQLAPHADNAGAFMEIFGQRAGPGMLALVSQGSDALRSMTTELDNAGGTAERIAAVQMEGFNGQMKALSSAFEGVKIAVGKAGFLDLITQAAQKITEVIQAMATADPKTLKLAAIFTGIVAAVAPLAAGIGLVVTALSAPAIGLIAVGALAVAGFVTFRDEIASAFGGEGVGKAGEAIAAFSEKFPALSDAIGAIASVLKNDFGKAVDAAKFAIETTITAIGVAFEGIKETVTQIVTAIDRLLAGDLSGAFEAGVAAVRAFGTTVVEVLKTLFGDVVRGIAEIAGAIMDGLKSGIAAKMQSVRDTITGLGDSVSTWFKETLGIASPSTVFMEFGQFLLDGLIAGIKAKIGAVKESINGVASSVSGWFKKTLGIESPSKVFREFGQFIAEGLAIGIADKSGDAVSAASGLADAIGSVGSEITGSLKSALKTGEADFDSFGDTMRGIADRLRDNLIDRAFKPIEDGFNSMIDTMVDGLSSAGTGNSGGGFLSGIGSVLSAGLGFLQSFDGGGYTGSGARSGGVDGKGGFAAILHPNETVIDHTLGQRAQQPVNVTNAFDVRVVSSDPKTRVDIRPRQSRQQVAAAGNAAINRGTRYR